MEDSYCETEGCFSFSGFRLWESEEATNVLSTAMKGAVSPLCQPEDPKEFVPDSLCGGR
jgi:hypothetical protein